MKIEDTEGVDFALNHCETGIAVAQAQMKLGNLAEARETLNAVLSILQSCREQLQKDIRK